VQYKAEAFHGDEIEVAVSVENMSAVSFDLFYKLTTLRNNAQIAVAYAKTGMIAFDYKQRVIMSLPADLQSYLQPG
jgi:acyl-CoA thioesterase FadM